MTWMNRRVSFYTSQTDNIGRPETFRDVILCEAPMRIETLVALRRLDKEDANYKRRKSELKSALPLFAPSAFMKTREAEKAEIIEKTCLLQMDWDFKEIQDYDIEELKAAIFALACVAFVAISCSGTGLYALIEIAEPDRLQEYAEHLFQIFKMYGIPPDTSKGRNYTDLRYVSYDSKMLIRDNPEPLMITKFYKKPEVKRPEGHKTNYTRRSHSGLIAAQLRKISNATTGSRWQTVQQVAFTLGGIASVGDRTILEDIYSAMEDNSEFDGEHEKYMECARVCFYAGIEKPLPELV